MKCSQIERGINNFSAASRGDQNFNRVFHPVSTTHPPRELKNDNSLSLSGNILSYQNPKLLVGGLPETTKTILTKITL